MQFDIRKWSSGMAIGLVLTMISQSPAFAAYLVQPGDSLYQLATRHDTTVEAIMAQNGLTDATLVAGQNLVLERHLYRVRVGDTLSGIAAAHGIGLQELRMANDIWVDLIHPGQELVIPVRALAKGSNTTHVVQRGDTLWHIARRYGTTVQALREANYIWTDHLNIGQTLFIHGAQLSARAGTVQATAARYTQPELEIMARIVHAEAAGESFQGQVAVAASVLNRVRDARYPDTVRGVVYQVINGYYQYSPVLDGRINLTPNASAYAAAREAFAGADPSGGANGFYNPVKTRNQWVRQQPVTVVLGNHVFFRS